MKFIMYVKNECSFFIQAVEELTERDIDFDVFFLDHREDTWFDLKKIYDWQTVPMIFEVIEDRTYKLIGGYTDLIERLGAEDI